MKLPVKINLLFTAIVTSILLAMAFLIYKVSSQNVQQDFRQRIKTRAARTGYMFQLFHNDTTNLLKSMDGVSPAALLNKNINIYDASGKMVYEYHDETTTPLVADTNWLKQEGTDNYSFFNAAGKEICVYQDGSGPNHIVILVASENVAGKEYLYNLQRIFWIFLPVSLLITIIVGYIFSKSLIKPVTETIHDVQLITSQNLSHRLYIGNKNSELSQLNNTFNDLLNRLEESFATQRRFISNASHELSTPLTAISSQIEVALLHNRDNEEYRRVLRSVLEDVRELHQLSKTLLDIAMAGTHGTISLDEIRIDEVLMKAHSDVLKQNHGFHVHVDFADLPEDEKECQVFGNPHLLQSAIKNIMENGCKYSPDHSVSARLLFKETTTEMHFHNQGDIIPDDEMSRLFEPFYRGDNAGGQPGVGLGLTLTKRIISLHKGSLHIQSDAVNGTIFSIILPTLKA